MASKELYNKVCCKCKKVFRTDKQRVTICPSCKVERKKAENKKQQEIYKKPKKKAKIYPVDIPLLEYTAIIEKYNREHKTHYTYGQFTMLLHNGSITAKEIEILQKESDA